MDERILKIKELMKNEAEAKKVFAGTKEEIKRKLDEKGISFSDEEFEGFINGIRESVHENNDELDETSLENVSGGSKASYDYGYEVGKTIGRIFKIFKWFGSLFG